MTSVQYGIKTSYCPYSASYNYIATNIYSTTVSHLSSY